MSCFVSHQVSLLMEVSVQPSTEQCLTSHKDTCCNQCCQEVLTRKIHKVYTSVEVDNWNLLTIPLFLILSPVIFVQKRQRQIQICRTKTLDFWLFISGRVFVVTHKNRVLYFLLITTEEKQTRSHSPHFLVSRGGSCFIRTFKMKWKFQKIQIKWAD